MVREHAPLMMQMMDTYAPARQVTVELSARMVSISTINKLIYIMWHIKLVMGF